MTAWKYPPILAVDRDVEKLEPLEPNRAPGGCIIRAQACSLFFFNQSVLLSLQSRGISLNYKVNMPSSVQPPHKCPTGLAQRLKLMFCKKYYRALIASLYLVLLCACAAPLQRADVAPEGAMSPYHDHFWKQVADQGDSERFHLLNTNAEALTWRLRMIDSAHHAIDLETFLWQDDKAGFLVLNHLLAAADRGVQVRILLDDSFTVSEDIALLAVDSHPNIELRVYNPYRNRGGGMLGRTAFNLDDFQRVNHRMHNKTLIVDGWVVNVGGRNLADEYFGLDDGYNFRDMEVLAMGRSATAVADHFAAFWNSGWSFPVTAAARKGSGPHDLAALRQVIDNAVGPADVADESELLGAWQQVSEESVAGRAHFIADAPAHENPQAAADQPTLISDFLLESIASARGELVLVSAYLVPTEELASALADSVNRGVAVRILTNSLRSNNHLAAYAAYHRYLRSLLQSGVELHELRTDAVDRNLYMESPVDNKELGLHAKFMLIDRDRVFIGSSNLDPRSLKLNTEVGMMVSSEELNRRLRNSIAVDFLPRNAWSVRLDGSGNLIWQSDGERLHHPPADSLFQRLESWFIGLLPIDSQM